MRILFVSDAKADCSDGGNHPPYVLVDGYQMLSLGDHCACWGGCGGTVSKHILKCLFGGWDAEVTVPDAELWKLVDAYGRWQDACQAFTDKYCPAKDRKDGI